MSLQPGQHLSSVICVKQIEVIQVAKAELNLPQTNLMMSRVE